LKKTGCYTPTTMSHRPSVEFLRDYIAIPSVNPMGRHDVPDAVAGERRYAVHVREQLRGLGLDAELIGNPDRPSVVAEATAPGATDTVLVASHLDTVPVDTMEIDPFDPVIRDGRLYGRGSCDTKGGMAALVEALAHTLGAGTLRRNVIVVGEADEEFTSTGVQDVLDHLGTRQPGWLIATEPTEMKVVTRHKGIALIRVCAHGRACHSSDPAAGSNAIVSLSRAVLALESLCAELSHKQDPVLGPATLSVGLVGGGMAPNIVPDAAWLISDWRLLPGQDEAHIRASIEEALARHGASDVSIEDVRVEKSALGTAEDDPSVRRCLSALESVGIPAGTGAVAFGTDAGLLADPGGIPAVVMGPGSIRQAHTAREFVEVAQVEAAARFFRALLESAD
jgi:acetylornithine deacetylase/succinyl-diaminopimelate desuccinylase-like protein